LIILKISLTALFVMLVVFLIKDKNSIIFKASIFLVAIFSQFYAIHVLPLGKLEWVFKPFIGFYYQKNNTPFSGRIIDAVFGTEFFTDVFSSPIILVMIAFLLFFLVTRKMRWESRQDILQMLGIAIVLDLFTRILNGNYAHDFIFLSPGRFGALIPDVRDVILFFVVVKFFKSDVFDKKGATVAKQETIHNYGNFD